jgi:iron complex outermembrane receptor protein
MATRLSAFLLVAGLAFGQADGPRDLSDASLEQLMNIQVTSVSKKGQSLSKTAASVFVITAEDIRRSGLHSLPELLRLAPGVQVARSSAGSWAISIRGFNDEFANKLLVLVDGRSIYNELFSGVFWDAMAIDNIENRVGKITLKQVEEIAKIKMPDLNCFTVEAAMNSVKGTALSMGVDVV